MKSPNRIDAHVGGRLRIRRNELRISREALASALGTGVRQIQNWEMGTDRIGASSLLELTKILGVTPSYLFANAQAVAEETRSKNAHEPQRIRQLPPTVETLRLINAFADLDDPEARTMVIDIIETIAQDQIYNRHNS